MKRSSVLFAVAAALLTVATVVLLGWGIQSRMLVSLLPGAVTTKPLTAVCFFLCGVLFTTSLRNDATNDIVQAWCCLSIDLLMGLTLIDSIYHVDTGVTQLLFVEPPEWAENSLAPGLPSLGTIVSFLLIATVYWTRLLSRRVRLVVGCSTFSASLIATISMAACFGHAFGVQELTLNVPQVSGGMSLPAALLFVVASIGLVYLNCPLQHIAKRNS